MKTNELDSGFRQADAGNNNKILSRKLHIAVIQFDSEMDAVFTVKEITKKYIKLRNYYSGIFTSL